MSRVRIFECPFISQCRAKREPETLYADNRSFTYFPPIVCQAPFIENKVGNPICRLDIDGDKLNIKNYRSGIERVQIHREETSLIEDLKEVFERRRKRNE